MPAFRSQPRVAQVKDIEGLRKLGVGILEARIGDRTFVRHINPQKNGSEAGIPSYGGFVETTSYVGAEVYVHSRGVVEGNTSVIGENTTIAGTVSGRAHVYDGSEIFAGGFVGDSATVTKSKIHGKALGYSTVTNSTVGRGGVVGEDAIVTDSTIHGVVTGRARVQNSTIYGKVDEEVRIEDATVLKQWALVGSVRHDETIPSDSRILFDDQGEFNTHLKLFKRAQEAHVDHVGE